MIKFRVHIYNEGTYIDENIYVDIMLPAVPCVGGCLYLSDEHYEVLRDKAKIASKDDENYPEWYDKRFNDYSFDCAIIVKTVHFNADSEIVHLEINETE